MESGAKTIVTIVIDPTILTLGFYAHPFVEKAPILKSTPAAAPSSLQ